MGICESPLEKSNQLTENIQPPIIKTKKPVTPIETDEKSDDTMNYQKIGLNESFNSETNIKKREENSMDEKEKSTNDTYQPQINQDLNLMGTNQNKSYASNDIQQGISQNLSQGLNNSNNFNKSGQFGNNNNFQGSNMLNNTNKLHVSLHESHASQSAFLNIPNQDHDPINAINSVTESLFLSQKKN